MAHGAAEQRGISLSFVGLPVNGGLTAPAHDDALDRQTFSQRWKVVARSRVSLLLLASMPVAFPDGPSDAEEGERRRGINAPPGNGQKKRAAHMDVQEAVATTRSDGLPLF